MNGPHLDRPIHDQPIDEALMDKDALARLIGQAGSRHSAPAAIAAQVRTAVHAEWQQLLQQRQRRRRLLWLAAASVLLGVIGIVSFGWQAQAPAPLLASNVTSKVANIALANISYSRGMAQLDGQPVSQSQSIHARQLLRTTADSGMRIETSSGFSLRVAAASELRWLNDHEVQLLQGAVYVDSHDQAAPLVIHARRADITHTGTQYQVNTADGAVTVAVRSGTARVIDTVSAASSAITTRQQLRIDAAGRSTRTTLGSDDASWQWADALATPFKLESHSVAEFLQWVAAETGHELRYANAAARAAANAAILHGQDTRLAPLQAMQVVLATTDLHVDVQGSQLVVSQPR